IQGRRLNRIPRAADADTHRTGCGMMPGGHGAGGHPRPVGIGKTGRSHHNPVDAVLSRLEGVRQTGTGRWLARCPGPLHRRGDRNPSLSIGETSDQTVLIRCFAGCEPTEILGAVGLELRDLFPPRESGYATRPTAPRIPWRDLLEALERDLVVASIAFSGLARGDEFTVEQAHEMSRFAADLADKIREVRHA
uniref:hypothetical protein n=1 Tax=Methylocaldum sp. TaxID=1969727 RepID=UPI00321F72D4